MPKSNSSLPLRVVEDGRIAELVRSRQPHRANCCSSSIESNVLYYSVTLAGAGLGSIKRPDRVHITCLKKYFAMKKERNA